MRKPKQKAAKLTAMQVEFARLHKELAALGDRANALFAKADVSYRQNVLWFADAQKMICDQLAERNDIKQRAAELDARFQRLINRTYSDRWPSPKPKRRASRRK